MPLRLAATLLAIAGAANAVGDDDYRDATVRLISGVDCVDATNFVAEFDPAPRKSTYMRVQHVGDPGTAELAGEVANVVTWNVGAVTGFFPPPTAWAAAQRGYRDVGPPAPASAFQLWCDGAGFFIDTRRFSHASPLVLEGPSASVARDLDPPAAVFGNATSALTIEAAIRVPFMQVDAPPVAEATAQVSFFYYVRDMTTGTSFVHVIALYENRPPGTNGAGIEAVSADAYTAFVTSPLAPLTASGAPVEFASPAADSAIMQFGAPWSDARRMRVHVSYERFRAMLARLIRESLPAISPRPQDYRVTAFGVLGEVFAGKATANEVALGASVAGLQLTEVHREVAPVPVVEFYNAALEHYFFSSRADDIDALDTGRLQGWTRTGADFAAWPRYVDGTVPVCRYYLPPQVGDSHFFSGADDECRAVAARYPEFMLEDSEAMFVVLPDRFTGECPAGTRAVYRLWNARAATNHRYTTDAAIRRQMIDAGWTPEGYGDSGVAMCAPPLSVSTGSGQAAR